MLNILPRGPLRLSTLENSILITFIFGPFGGYPPNGPKINVIRMEFSRVESLSGPRGSMFSIFRGSQLNSISRILLKLSIDSGNWH